MNRKLLALALPSIVANITTPLLGLVDTAIVGHMGSADYIGAIAVGGVMFNMLYWLFSFLRGGTSGLAAQAYGANNSDEQARVLYRSLSIACGIGVLMILLQWPLQWLLLHFINATTDTATLASTYFSILIYGAPAVLGTYALSGWFLGMQNTTMLMITSIIVNITNIALSLTLVYALGWQVEGVATGTLVAQWIGFGVGLWLLRRYRPRWQGIKQVMQAESLKRFFKVNVEVMLRTLCLIAVTVWFTKLGAQQGDVTLAINTLLMQLFLLFSYFMDGFAYAAEALVGKSVGAAAHHEQQQCVKTVFGWGIFIATLFFATYAVGGERFLQLLSNNADVVAAANHYYLWAAAIPFASFAAFVWDGVFIGATMTRQLLTSMLAAMITFFVVAYSLMPTMGNNALWLAFILYLAMRGAVQTWQYAHHINKGN